MTINDIKTRAIKVEDNMEVGWANQKNFGRIKIEKLPIKDNIGKYHCHNRILGFIDQKGTMYVIPALPGVRQVVEASGYTKGRFCIPFSHLEYPMSKQNEWESLFGELSKDGTD